MPTHGNNDHPTQDELQNIQLHHVQPAVTKVQRQHSSLHHWLQ